MYMCVCTSLNTHRKVKCVDLRRRSLSLSRSKCTSQPLSQQWYERATMYYLVVVFLLHTTTLNSHSNTIHNYTFKICTKYGKSQRLQLSSLFVWNFSLPPSPPHSCMYFVWTRKNMNFKMSALTWYHKNRSEKRLRKIPT